MLEVHLPVRRDESRDQSQSLLDIRRDSVKPDPTLARCQRDEAVANEKLTAPVDLN
jgi:hypothetical protein